MPSLRSLRSPVSRSPPPGRRHGVGAELERTVVPLDPRLTVQGDLDPSLDEIRAGLASHRRRLWMRRIVRRAWRALAGDRRRRSGPARRRPARARSRSCRPWSRRSRSSGIGDLAGERRPGPARASARQPWRSTARGTSATASRAPCRLRRRSRPWPDRRTVDVDDPDLPVTEAAEAERFVRRQRRDAVGALRIAPPNLFRPRFSRQPAAIALAATLLIVPFTPAPERPGHGDRAGARQTARKPSSRRRGSTRSRRSWSPRARSRTIPGRAWPPTCAISPPSSARTPRTSRPISPGSARSRRRSTRSSIRATSSGRRR